MRLNLLGHALLCTNADERRADRGFDVYLLGTVEVDPRKVRLVRFDVVAVGDHWGEGTYTRGARPAARRWGSRSRLPGKAARAATCRRKGPGNCRNTSAPARSTTDSSPTRQRGMRHSLADASGYYPRRTRNTMTRRRIRVTLLAAGVLLGLASPRPAPGRRTSRPWPTISARSCREAQRLPHLSPARQARRSRRRRASRTTPSAPACKACGRTAQGRQEDRPSPRGSTPSPSEDSDGDGVPNLLEMLSGHNPGDAERQAERPPRSPRPRSSLTAFRKFLRGLSVATVRDGAAAARARGEEHRLGAQPHRRLPRRRARGTRPEAAAGGPRAVLLRRVYLDLIGLPPTRDGTARLPRRHVAGRVREGGRSPAGQPAVRRALGPALDGRLALQRLGRLRRRGAATASRTSGTGATGSSSRSTRTRATTA